MVVIGVLGFFGYHRITEKARKYTAQSAKPVPVEKATQEEYDALVKRMDAFKNAAPGSNEELTLSAHDLNTLIAFAPDWRILRGKIQIAIDNGNTELIGSIPLAFIPELRDRYLEGSLYFIPSMDNKVLHISLQNIKLNGHELSKDYLKAAAGSLESQMANRLLGDPVIGPVLIKAETLKVGDGALVLTPAK